MTHLEGGVAGTAECPLVLLADSGQSVDEGTLVPSAFMNSATLAGGRIAFFAMIDGSARNQGVFRAEGGIATPVAIGCGSGGGSGDPGSGVGDPTPIGGTFTGFFGGTFFAPAINALGDVLFMADLHGGSSPRGLFVGHLNGTIDNVARVGGPAPGGGTFVNVGHGSINDAGTVAFVGRASVDTGPGIFTWTNGTLQKIARPGSPAPGGGTYTIIVGETLGFSDGTNIPVGPLPDINNLGTIAFRTLASGSVSRGIVLRTSAGVATWAVKANTATPIGGTFFDMQGASLNDAGELCFFADVNISGTFTSGLFAGLPNQLHKALAFYDEFDGGTVTGLAFSRNPMQFIDADGNVVAWCNVDLPGGVSHGRIVTIDPAGLIVTRAEQGDPSANGGTIGSIDAWPSAQSGFGVTLSTGTPGAPSGQSAHQLVPACAACVGDLTNDGEVDAEDLATLLGAWSTAGPGDLDASGTVNAADLAVLLGAWGNCG
ncbi:MAG: hypothetical protein JNL80_08355 [Phycisphaerae bacterium]|nr:hypothetical protein [Phycisphaerae bacterium]